MLSLFDLKYLHYIIYFIATDFEPIIILIAIKVAIINFLIIKWAVINGIITK